MTLWELENRLRFKELERHHHEMIRLESMPKLKLRIGPAKTIKQIIAEEKREKRNTKAMQDFTRLMLEGKLVFEKD